MSNDNLLEIGISVQLSDLQSGFQDAVAITDSATQRMADAFAQLNVGSAEAAKKLTASWSQSFPSLEARSEQAAEAVAEAADKAARDTLRAQAAAIDGELELDKSAYEQKVRNTDFLAQLGALSSRQKLDRLRAALDEEYELEYNALTRKLQLYDLDAAEFQKTLNKMQQFGQQYRLSTEKLTQQATLDWSKEFDTAFNHINQTFRTANNGVIQGSQTLGQAFSRLGASMVSDFAASLEKMVMQFIASRIKMLVFHQAAKAQEVATEEAADEEERSIGFASTLRDVTQSAVKAAGKAYSWGAEIGGPPLGAAMAAIAFAGVEAFGALASAAGGWDYVPNTSLAVLHPREMVLSAPMATGLRNVISSFSQPQMSFAGGGAGTSGNTSVSVPIAVSINAIDAQSMQDAVNSVAHTIGNIAQQRIQRVLSDRGFR